MYTSNTSQKVHGKCNQRLTPENGNCWKSLFHVIYLLFATEAHIKYILMVQNVDKKLSY